MPVTSDGEGGQPSESRPLVRTARLLAGLTAMSRLAGLARDAAIGAAFGAGPVADAFFVAFRIPNFLRRVVAEGGISTALVPLLTHTLQARGREAALRRAGAAGGTAAAILFVSCALGMLFSGPLTAAFAPGFDGEGGQLPLATRLFFWMVPYVFLVGMAAWATAVLQTFRVFAPTAIGPVLFNLGVVAAVLVLAPRLGDPEAALVLGVLAGGGLHLLAQLPALGRLGFRAAWFRTRPDDGDLQGMLRATGSALAGGSIHQVNVLVGTVLASLLGGGAVSWLWYADRLLEFPLGIVAVAVGTASLPSLAGHAGAARQQELCETLDEALRLTLAFSLPAALGLGMLAGDLTSLLLERGSFDALDSERTAQALVASAPGLLGIALVKVLAATLQVLRLARAAVACALASVALSLFLGVFLAGPFDLDGGLLADAVSAVSRAVGGAGLGHAGIALAAALASLFQAAALLLLLGRALPAWRPRRLLRPLARQFAACSLMGAALLAWKALAPALGLQGGGVASTSIALVTGAVVYLGAAHVLGSEEVTSALGLRGRQSLVRGRSGTNPEV